MMDAKSVFWAIAFLCAAVSCGGEQADNLCEFSTAEQAADEGWYAKATAGKPQPALLVTKDAKIGQFAVEARGVEGQGEYGGLRLARRMDLTGCGANDKLCFWVKQNAAEGVTINIGFENGPNFHRAVPASRGKWTYIEVDLDPKNWSGRTEGWGVATRVAFYARAFDSSDEYLCLDGLHFQTASGQELFAAGGRHGPALKKWSFPQETETHWILGNERVAFAISKETGSVEGGWNVGARTRYLDSLQTVYFVESRSFGKEFNAESDRVESTIEFAPTSVKIQCRNPNVPELSILKQYDVAPDDNKLVHTLTLINEGKAADWYATPSSRISLRRTFRDPGFYLGSGYVGPLIPAPELTAPVRVSRYRISPKGMLLVNRKVGYTLAHYRFRVNGHFLFPWVSKYVEAANALFHTPTGWQFGLATVALRPGKPVSIEEHVMIMPGTQHDFLSREYPGLPAVAERLQQLTPRPDWRKDIKVYIGAGMNESMLPTVQQLVELTEEGNILVLMSLFGPWTDYPTSGELTGPFGGKVDAAWVKKLVAELHGISPRVKVSVYTWIISASWNATAYLEHPNWFRPCNKDGSFVNLFPGCAANYATLVEKPACRDFLLKQYADHLRDWDLDAIYLDGAKTTNLIDWQQNTLTQDTDWEDFWLRMREVCRQVGPEKALFFNGRANLYADISFIEARSEMREANWRDYAGLMVATKSFISNDPGFVIIPLYWIERIATPYVNHFVPLGYTPAIGHGSPEALRRLPFITAAYELKDVKIVEIGLEPNWQEDALTRLESYAMRQGDAYGIGLIGHYENPTEETVSVEAKRCGFDGTKPVYAWVFDLADPGELKGRTSEKEIKDAYRQTGWFLDRTTSVECKTLKVDAQGRVGTQLRFARPVLKVLALTQTPAAVMSIDGLPVHFNLPTVRGVSITAKDEKTVEVTCHRDECEIIVPAHSAVGAHVWVDGTKAASETIAFGGGFFEKVAVGRGAHTVRWAYQTGPQDAEPLTLKCPDKIAPGQKLPIEIHSHGAVVLEAALNGRPVFSKKLPSGTQQTSLAVPAALASGTLELVAHSTGGGTARAKAIVAEADYTPGLKVVFPESGPPECKMWNVNKTIRDIRVLRAATERWHSALGCEHVARVEPEQLRFEVGSSDWFTSFMGYGFAGIEAEGLRVLTLDVHNTFFGAFNLRATKYHLHPYKKTTHPFAGVMVDYHTPQGYTKRIALSMGLLDVKRTSPLPSWGANKKPDQFVELGKIIDEGEKANITVNLGAYAPKDWDGRVWFAPGVQWVAPGRRLIVTIVRSEKEASGPVTVGMDMNELLRTFKEPRLLDVPRATFVPETDGVMDEEAWREAVEIDDFVLVNEAGLPTAWTRARLFYDDNYLYIGIQCQEPARPAPIVGNESIWRDDEVELWFDVDGDPKTYHQLIINARGDTLGLVPEGQWEHGARCGAQFRNGVWIVEVAVPFASLGRKPEAGDTWRFNIARHRPASATTNNELITWSVLHGSFRSVNEFGTLTFRGTVGK